MEIIYLDFRKTKIGKRQHYLQRFSQESVQSLRIFSFFLTKSRQHFKHPIITVFVCYIYNDVAFLRKVPHYRTMLYTNNLSHVSKSVDQTMDVLSLFYTSLVCFVRSSVLYFSLNLFYVSMIKPAIVTGLKISMLKKTSCGFYQ